MKRRLYGAFADSTAGRKVIFYRKEVKDNELLNRNVYYFARISIMKNFAGKRRMVVTATG
ncbi:hypothetical protein [Chitinophaga filiformis]|uniref:hypothetical protein n=1 Tax=Chitinophaga filiformis TaxID=104663 RepID=UPI000B7D02A1|nr:hypothetical protein [Chitinophaga filiformis]